MEVHSPRYLSDLRVFKLRVKGQERWVGWCLVDRAGAHDSHAGKLQDNPLRKGGGEGKIRLDIPTPPPPPSILNCKPTLKPIVSPVIRLKSIAPACLPSKPRVDPRSWSTRKAGLAVGGPPQDRPKGPLRYQTGTPKARETPLLTCPPPWIAMAWPG